MSSEEVDPIGNAKVLLIEDSRDHQFLFLKRLSKIGLKNVIICETGELGIKKIKAITFKDNFASIKLVKRLGFKKVGENKKEFFWEKKLK